MTFITFDARLPPTATLCMPGFPPSPRVRCRKACINLPYLTSVNRHTRYRPATTTRNTVPRTLGHAAVASLGSLTHRRGFSRKHMLKGQLNRHTRYRPGTSHYHTKHCHAVVEKHLRKDQLCTHEKRASVTPSQNHTSFNHFLGGYISGRANSPHLGATFPFQG